MQTYQNVTTVTNLDMSRKTVTRKPDKKNQGTTRTNIIKTNAIIEKWITTKNNIATIRKYTKNIL